VLIVFTVSNIAASSNRLHFIVSLMGENSVPPVTSSATGTATLSLSEDLTELEYHKITFTPTSANFYPGFSKKRHQFTKNYCPFTAKNVSRGVLFSPFCDIMYSWEMVQIFSETLMYHM